jgi:probable rRNA maturation factor
MEEEPAYRILVNVQCTGEVVSSECLIRAIESTLLRHGVASAEIGVVVVDDAAIAGLHMQHLGQPDSTDVLTFDLSDDADVKRKFGEATAQCDGEKPRHRRHVEGEIVVSLETATREAKARGHEVTPELALYAVHGALHLLGYTDHRLADAARMHAEEDAILIELGWGPVYGAGVR